MFRAGKSEPLSKVGQAACLLQSAFTSVTVRVLQSPLLSASIAHSHRTQVLELVHSASVYAFLAACYSAQIEFDLRNAVRQNINSKHLPTVHRSLWMMAAVLTIGA